MEGLQPKVPRKEVIGSERFRHQQVHGRPIHHSDSSATNFIPRIGVEGAFGQVEDMEVEAGHHPANTFSTVSLQACSPLEQITRMSQGRQRAAIFYGRVLPEITTRLKNTPGVEWRELPSSPAGKVIICWKQGSSLGVKAASDIVKQLDLIDRWQDKAKNVYNLDDDIRRATRDCLLLEAQIELIDGDDSWKDLAQRERWECAKLCLPKIVGSTRCDDILERVHYRFTNFLEPEHLRRKLYVHLNDLGYWKGAGNKERDAFLDQCGSFAYFGGSLEANAVQTRTLKIQDLQKKSLSGNPTENFSQAKGMIHQLDELEKELYDACNVAVGGKSKKGWASAFMGLFAFGSKTEPSDVFKNQKLLDDENDGSVQKDRAYALNNLLRWVQQEKKLIVQVASDPGAGLCAEKLTWNEAIEFKRCGYNLDPSFTVCSALKDQYLQDKEGKVLGEGMFHKAIELDYTRNKTVCTRVFKGISSCDRSGWREIVGKELFMDKKSPRHSARNIAVREIASELGIEERVPDCEFAVHNLQFGVLMSKAEGLKGTDSRVRGKAGLGLNFSDIDRHKTFCYNTIKHLNQLEWLDALCANLDRNDGNIMFDSSGLVTGIDHDACLYPFPEIIRKPLLSDASVQEQYRAGCRVGFPLVIDSQTLDKLERLDIKALRYQLRKKLTVKELDALEKRYELLLEHARGLASQGFSIQNWERWRDSENRNVYRLLIANEIRGGNDGEKAACRERLAAPHKDEARFILLQAGGKEEGMTEKQRLKYKMHLNLETTKRLGLNTSYTSMYFGIEAQQSRTG